MILRELKLEDDLSFQRFLDDWDGASGFSQLYGLIAGLDFSTYLKILEESKAGINLPANLVQSTNLFAFIGKEIIGKVSVRHELNEGLMHVGGHIGYGVITQHRGKGYATQMLQGALEYCRSLNLNKVLLTCDESNIPSVKIIQKCGGIFENLFDPKDGSSKKMRFWIML